MGYSASKLRMTGGMSDEELAGVLGLAMDRRAMELLFSVAEASTTRLPRSEESQEIEQGALTAIPIAGVSEASCAPEAAPEPTQAQLAEWVTRSSDYTRHSGSLSREVPRHTVHEDELCLEWLKTGGSVMIPKEDYQRVRKRAARHRWDELTGELYMVTIINGKELLVPKPGRDRLRAYHERTGHWGIRRTLNLLWQRHYWVGGPEAGCQSSGHAM
eukprot:gene34411-biopygen29036